MKNRDLLYWPGALLSVVAVAVLAVSVYLHLYRTDLTDGEKTVYALMTAGMGLCIAGLGFITGRTFERVILEREERKLMHAKLTDLKARGEAHSKEMTEKIIAGEPLVKQLLGTTPPQPKPYVDLLPQADEAASRAVLQSVKHLLMDLLAERDQAASRSPRLRNVTAASRPKSDDSEIIYDSIAHDGLDERLLATVDYAERKVFFHLQADTLSGTPRPFARIYVAAWTLERGTAAECQKLKQAISEAYGYLQLPKDLGEWYSIVQRKRSLSLSPVNELLIDFLSNASYGRTERPYWLIGHNNDDPFEAAYCVEHERSKVFAVITVEIDETFVREMDQIAPRR